MAKILRKTQKIFAEDAPTSQLTTFGTAKAATPNNSRDLDDIQNANYSDGWAAAVEADMAPFEEDTNGLFYAITKQLAYIFQEGIPEYDSGTEYSDSSIVKTISGGELILYLSLQSGNTGNALTDTAYWKELRFPGQWQIVDVQVSTAKAIGTHTHDLSGTIPADGYMYEAIFRVQIGRKDDSNANSEYDVKQGAMTWLELNMQGGTSGDDYTYDSAQFTVIFPSNSRAISDVIAGKALNSQNLRLRAYRRLGTF